MEWTRRAGARLTAMDNSSDLDALQQYRYDVFLSYSFQNEDTARRIYDRLGAATKLFFAPIDLPAGLQQQARFQYASLLADALVRSCHFVAVLSEPYLDSSWCRIEMMGFFNLLKGDRGRRMWLCAQQPLNTPLNAHLRSFVVSGSEEEALARIAKELAEAPRRTGSSLGFPPPVCLRPLPLREIYRPPKPAPWGFESQSRGLPGAPPYEVYEALVREYMVQLLRKRDVGKLDIPMEGIDARYAYLSNRARKDAEFFLSRRIDPFADRKPYSEICVELMFLMGAGGESEHNLRGMAECRSYMGPDSYREALSIAEDCIARFGGAAIYQRIRARAHYGLREYASAVRIIEEDATERFTEHWLLLAASHAQLGNQPEARRAAAKALESNPAFNCTDERIETPREDDEDIEHWIEGLTKAGLPVPD